MVNREMGDFGWLISTTRSFYFNNLFVIDYILLRFLWQKYVKSSSPAELVLLRNKNFLHKFWVILLIKYTNKRDEAKILYSQVMLGHVNVDQMKKNVREQFYAGFFIWIYIFQPIFWINCSSPPAKNLCKNVHFYFLGNKCG